MAPLADVAREAFALRLEERPFAFRVRNVQPCVVRKYDHISHEWILIHIIINLPIDAAKSPNRWRNGRSESGNFPRVYVSYGSFSIDSARVIC